MTTLPPRVVLSWDPTAFSVAFREYRVYRRPARLPVHPWERLATISVPDGYDAATVEAQHTSFIDYEAGWHRYDGGEWDHGWDYAVASVGLLETELSTIEARKQVASDLQGWVTCNQAPYLNFGFTAFTRVGTSAPLDIITTQLAGRDLAVTTIPAEIPSREMDGLGQFFEHVSTDQLDIARAAQQSGRQVALLRPLGDRILGTLMVSSWEDVRVARTNARFGMIETSKSSAIADYNLASGVVLDGTADVITIADNALLDPGSSPFSVVCAAAFPAGSFTPLSKGNLSVGDGYGFVTSATQMSWWVDGASAIGNPAETSPVWFDGDVHVAVGTTSGTTQKLYRDGSLVASFNGTHGAVSNAISFAVGANNGGTSSFSALEPIQAFAVYLRELTASEADDASRYLLGDFTARMPAGAVLFVDLRDARTWKGFGTSLADLSGNGLNATLISAPPTRGIPWALSELERF